MAEDKDEENSEAEENTEEDQENSDEDGEGGEGGEDGEGKKKSSKLKLIIIAAVVVVAIAVPAVLYLTGFFTKEQNENVRIEPIEGQEATADEDAIIEHAVYYDMEEFIVNLNVGSQRPSFLKMTISLELSGESQIPRIEERMPRIRDNFQIYLRELRQEDLQGSAGLYRLREELLLRINKIVYPAKISDILFKEILVQ